jgi:hypothetical protein
MTEQAMLVLQKLLASRSDAAGAHCSDPPPEEVDGGADELDREA